jgi:hypothetical protein
MFEIHREELGWAGRKLVLETEELPAKPRAILSACRRSYAHFTYQAASWTKLRRGIRANFIHVSASL